MRIATLLPALLLLAPLAALPAHAGSGQDPEIQDGTRDVDATYGFGVHTTIGAPEVDITKAWFASNATTVSVFWEVVDASHRVARGESRDYTLTCSSGADVVLLGAGLTDDPQGVTGAFIHVSHADQSVSGATIPVSVEGNVVRVDAPRAFFSASTCAQTRAYADVLVETSPGFWSEPGYGVLWWNDIAPDSGYGRDAVLT